MALWYREANFPPGLFAPYQVELDGGHLIFAPEDSDRCIKAAPADLIGGLAGMSLKTPSPRAPPLQQTPSARQLTISNFDVRPAVRMEKVTASLEIQEVELVKLQVEVDELLEGSSWVDFNDGRTT